MTVSPPRKRQRTVPRAIYRWLVISGEYQTYWGSEYDPPEYGCAVVYVDAWTVQEARVKAIRTPEFAEWVDLQRGDGKHPCSGIKCERMHAVLP